MLTDLVTGLCEFSLLYVLSLAVEGDGEDPLITHSPLRHTYTENESQGEKHTPQFLGTKQSQAGF